MVARLFRLRVTLLGGYFRGSLSSGLRATLRLLLAFVLAAVVALIPVWAIEHAQMRNVVDILMISGVLGGIIAYSFFDPRRILESRQFAMFPYRSGTIAWGLLVTSVISWPFLVFLTWLITLFLTRPGWLDAGWVAPTAAVLIGLLVVTGVRFWAGLSQLISGPRLSGVLRVFGVLLVIAAIPVAGYALATVFRPEQEQLLTDAADVLGWTPLGAGPAAIIALAAGDESAALLRTAMLAGCAVLSMLLWFAVVHASNQRIERPGDKFSARRGLGWFERFAPRPAAVIAARQLTYWARDPRYRTALYAIPIAPIVMLVAFWVAGADLRTLAVLPLPVLLLLLGWSQHNDVAMDSTAIWEHVASGVSGRADRVGRLAPVMMLGIPLALIGSSLTVTIIGDWRIFPALLGLNLGVLFTASGVSSVFSALTPYPATRPGESPFAQPQWSGSGAGLAQTLSMLCATLLSIPPIWWAVEAMITIELGTNMWALVLGVSYGLVVLGLGIVIGGAVFKRRAPELIAITQMFD